MVTKIKYFKTLPGYNYAGPSSNGGEPVSWLDAIAKNHDRNMIAPMVSTWTFKISIDDAILNTEAHMIFIAEYFTGVLSLFTFTYRHNTLTQNNPLWWTIKDAFFGLLGCVLFVVDIAGNLLNYYYRMVKK